VSSEDGDQTGDIVTHHASDSSEESEKPPLLTQPDPISLCFLFTQPFSTGWPLKGKTYLGYLSAMSLFILRY